MNAFRLYDLIGFMEQRSFFPNNDMQAIVVVGLYALSGGPKHQNGTISYFGFVL